MYLFNQVQISVCKLARLIMSHRSILSPLPLYLLSCTWPGSSLLYDSAINTVSPSLLQPNIDILKFTSLYIINFLSFSFVILIIIIIVVIISNHFTRYLMPTSTVRLYRVVSFPIPWWSDTLDSGQSLGMNRSA